MFYEIGIDNYIVTPIDLDLTVAKIKGSLAKSDEHGVNQNERILKAADLTMNLDTMEITRGTLKIELTALEFDLLRLFLVNKNMILSRDKILNTVWGYDNLNGTRLVDVHVSNLRKKIDGGFKNKLIQSLRGFGYKLVAD